MRFLPKQHIQVLAILFTGFILLGCSHDLRMQVMRPAPFTTPPHISKVLLVNRALKENTVINIIEGGVTGELPGQDREGMQHALDGLYEVLNPSQRYQVKRAASPYKTKQAGDALPEPMLWSKVNSLCQNNDVDAIICLELFDTDFIVTNGQKQKTVKNEDGVESTRTVYTAQGVASIVVGFRIYDPQNKSILDQKTLKKKRTWNAEGETVQDALAHLINRNQAIMQTARLAGETYGSRITPLPIWVSRYFFTKPDDNPNMATGIRQMKVDDWAGAAESFRKAQQSPDAKTAGRATFNLALIMEVYGDLDQALRLAQEAYVRYGQSRGKSYAAILRQRLADEEIVRHQMQTE